MEEWIQYRASEYCASVTDGTHDSPKPKEEGHYLITSKHLQNNSIDFSSAYKISDEDYQKVIQRSKVVQYDILFSMIGTIGNTVRVTSPVVDFAVKNMAIFKMGGDELKSKWLYYWLQSDFAKEYIASRLAGSTQSYLTLDSLRNFPVLAPGEKAMTKIVDILSCIDDKIELNNRINHNLEEQIQERFDSMIISDNGLGYCQIADYINVNPKRSLRKNELAKCVDMSYLSTTGPFPSGWETKGYNGGMKFLNGDTIMARITPCLENGKVAYVNFLDDSEVAFGSTEYIVLHAKEGVSPVFTYFLARNKNFVDYATKNMNGSSGRQRVSGDTIEKYMIPVIDNDSLKEFSGYATPAMGVIRNNSFESRSLAATRDTLLPLLLSGKLSISQKTC